MLLWHGSFSPVQHIIYKQLPEWKWLFITIDITALLFIYQVKMVSAGMPASDINIFTDFDVALRA